jgi:hypothetical protein
MCELCKDAAVIAAALIGYDDHGGYCRDDHKEKTIMIKYFLYTNVQLTTLYPCSHCTTASLHHLVTASHHTSEPPLH